MTISYAKFKDYEQKWVLINTESEEILDADKNIIKLQKRMENLVDDVKNITLFFVPSFHAYMAG